MRQSDMATYYAKRALEILREDGPVELSKSSTRFIKHYVRKKTSRNSTKIRIQNYIKHRLDGYSAIADPFKIITIYPGNVNYYTSKFGKGESVGKVSSGNWDKEAIPVEDMMKFSAVKQHFHTGVDWVDTGIIDYHCQRLAESDRTNVDGCSSRSEYIQWYKEIDDLYKDVKNHGYDREKHSSRNYIAVHIGRSGELIFAGSGCHRLSICKILDLDEIPVWVRARHKQWQELRDEIYNNGLPESRKDLRDHPDLQDVLN